MWADVSIIAPSFVHLNFLHLHGELHVESSVDCLLDVLASAMQTVVTTALSLHPAPKQTDLDRTILLIAVLIF